MVIVKLFENMDNRLVVNVNDIKIKDSVFIDKSNCIGIIDDINNNFIKVKYDNIIRTFDLPYLIKNKLLFISDNNSIPTCNLPQQLLLPKNIIQTDKITHPEEEEEEEDDIIDDIDTDDLLEINMDEYFDNNDMKLLLSYDEVKEKKKKLKKETANNPFKKEFISKQIRSIEILEYVFKLMSKKFKNKKIYKFTGYIPYNELWDIKRRERISLPNYTNIVGINSSLIYFWEFKDSVIIKI
jgi:hypothetical protein